MLNRNSTGLGTWNKKNVNWKITRNRYRYLKCKCNVFLGKSRGMHLAPKAEGSSTRLRLRNICRFPSLKGNRTLFFGGKPIFTNSRPWRTWCSSTWAALLHLWNQRDYSVLQGLFTQKQGTDCCLRMLTCWSSSWKTKNSWKRTKQFLLAILP